MSMLSSRNIDPFSESSLLQSLTSSEYRHNFLVVCGPARAEAVVDRLAQACSPPLHFCLLPGVLRLPSSGTLVLNHVDELTIGQQIALHDWLSARRGELQVVSLTEVALEELVRDGRFLEALFHTLNVVRLESRASTASLSLARNRSRNELTIRRGTATASFWLSHHDERAGAPARAGID